MEALYVGLYAVGSYGKDRACLFLTDVCSEGCQNGRMSDAPQLPFAMLQSMIPGLYIGVVTFGESFEVKVFSMSNQEMLKQHIPEKYHEQCEFAVSCFFRLLEDKPEGAPTPEYVDQDR